MTKRIIASLLLRNGRLVKGRAFQNHRDAGHPVTTIRALCAQGIDEILLLNIGDGHDWQTLEAAADECTVPLTFGGNIRTEEEARQAFLVGADKLYVPDNRHDLLQSLRTRLGVQAIVEGWHGRIFLPAAKDAGLAGEIRLVNIDLDGTRRGLDTDTIKALAKTGRPLIAEGGCGTLPHIRDGFRAGADAIALGTMLVFGDNHILKIKRYLRQEGIPVRLAP